MNVLHIGHSKGWRGGENQVRLLIEGLAESYPDVGSFIAYPENAQIIQRLKHTVSGVLMFSSTRIISLSALFKLVKFCQSNDIEILHAHSAKAHSLVYFAKLFLPNLKVAVHRRVDNRIKTSYFTRKKYLSEKIDAWLAVSDKTYAMLENYGVGAKRIFMVKDGVPRQNYKFPDKKSAKKSLIQGFGWRNEDPLIGFVSALDDQKNPLLFVDIVAQLRANGMLCNAVIAGTGKLDAAVSNEIIARGLSENIKLLGFIGNVQDIFQGIDIFILPSRNEGLGTVLLEAALAECVIIASDVGGIGEVVKHKQTGFLATSCAVDTFVDSMQYIIQNPQHVDAIKQNAQQYVEANFNLQTVVAKTRDVYLHLLS